jgi:catechol 2,3-dioxygenase-like lactoylglutathione lyase family enzyme
MSTLAAILASSTAQGSSAQGRPGGGANPPASAAAALVSVRYQVKDVDRSIAFYTDQLGFQLEQRSGAAFAAVLLGNLRLLLSGPGSSGSRPMPSGQHQASGGWNRILIYVPDLVASIRALEQAGVSFRNSVETGPGGSQIIIDDLDGNPIELHQPPGK